MFSVSLCGSSVKGTWREGSLARDLEGYVEKTLETGISFHRGSVWETWRRARLSVSLCGSSVKGTWREGSLARDLEGYVEKALETGISFHRGSVWGTWRRARLEGALRAV